MIVGDIPYFIKLLIYIHTFNIDDVDIKCEILYLKYIVRKTMTKISL